MTKTTEIHDDRKTYFADDPQNPNQLPLIADEINERVRGIKAEMYEVGRLLMEAKEMLPHGKFQKWIKDNFDFSYQTAKNFMNVHGACIGRPELVETINASVLYQIAAPGFPADLRSCLLEHSMSLKDISHKKIKDILRRYKKGEIGLDSPEIMALTKYHADEDEYTHYHSNLDASIANLKDLEEMVVRETHGQNWPT
jgi:hypothetical protein